jgi:arylsulfatase A-like enzyme
MTTLPINSSGLQPSQPSTNVNSQATADPPSNVVFISIDDLNDWIGVLNAYPGVKTPNIDRLAAQGMLFANAHTPVPICNAARTAVFTGLQPDTTKVYDNSQNWVEKLPNAITIPDYFRAHGYQDAGAGKLLHTNNNVAFENYFITNGPRVPPGVTPGQFGSTPLNVPLQDYADAQIATFAENYLAQSHESPFFLGLGFNRPHVPLSAPQEYFDLYPLDQIQLPLAPADDLNDVPAIGQEWAGGLHDVILRNGNWKEIVQAYLASISFMDAMVGRVLDALEQSQHSDNTMVVLWSDNGWHLGEKLHWQKQTLWEEATRVPLIISGPGIEAGQVSQKPVSLMDLFPTLVDLAGLPARPELEGRSLAPLLENPNLPWDHPVVTVWDKSYAVRSEQFRYIRYADGTEELYDHTVDPNELTNLAELPAYAEEKAILLGNLNDYFQDYAPRRVIADLIKGSELGDDLRGNARDNLILGFTGNDTLTGLDGNDQLFGMGDRDKLTGGKGNDRLYGGTGNDQLLGGIGNDSLWGGTDNDSLRGDAGSDRLWGEGGADTLNGGTGQDSLWGQSGNDLLIGGVGNDLIVGGDGQDILRVVGRIQEFDRVTVGTTTIIDRVPGNGDQGTDQLDSVEFIQFDNGVFDVQTGQITRGTASRQGTFLGPVDPSLSAQSELVEVTE